MSNKAPILNIAEVAFEAHGHGDKFAAQIGHLGRALGTQKLGCRLVVVPPGKRAWPYHLHHGNEELFVILEGQGTLRYDGERYPVKPGDVISTPVGPGTAHQLIASSDGELRYLALSTMIEPDTFEYPDSGKRGVMAGAAPGHEGHTVRFFTSNDAELDYWHGED